MKKINDTVYAALGISDARMSILNVSRRYKKVV